MSIPKAGDGGDSGLSKFKQIRTKLENAVGGTGNWYNGSQWIYPIEYNAQAIPPYWKAQNYIESMRGPNVQLSTSVPFTEEDQRVMKDKEDTVEKGELDRKFFELFKPFAAEPATRELLMKVYPEPFQRMRDTIAHRADLQKYVQTKLIDNIDEEQILLRMALAERPELQALLNTPVGPTPLTHAAHQGRPASQTTSFRRGLFNPYEAVRLKETVSTMRAAPGSVETAAQGYQGAQTTPAATFQNVPFGSGLYGPYRNWSRANVPGFNTGGDFTPTAGYTSVGDPNYSVIPALYAPAQGGFGFPIFTPVPAAAAAAASTQPAVL
jgi:hypothetical protein